MMGASSQPATPLKSTESSSTAPSAGNGPASTAPEDVLRFLQQNMQPGALIPPFLPGAPPSFPIPLLLGEMKPEMMGGGGPMHSYLESFGFHHPYGNLDGARRKNATRETTAPLKTWLSNHRKNPYPTKAEKLMLALCTKMTMTQVSTWFANARRRLKKENKMTWSPRNRPNDDDDDNLDLDGLQRPGSSASDISGGNGASPTSPNPAPAEETPKKNKIWSIADTVGETGSRASGTTPSASSTFPSMPPMPGAPELSYFLQHHSESAVAAMAAVQQQHHFAALMQRQMMGGGAVAPGGGAPNTMQLSMLSHLFSSMVQQRAAASAAMSVSSNGTRWPAEQSSSLSPGSLSNHSEEKPACTVTEVREEELPAPSANS